MIFGRARPGRRDGEVAEWPGARVRFRVNKRAKRVSLRLDLASGEVLAIAPSERKLADAEAFARSKTDWIARRLARASTRAPFAPGQVIPFQGASLRLAQGEGAMAARLSEDGSELTAGGDADGFSRRVTAWLKRRARATLVERSSFHAGRLHLPPPVVSLNDARTRWGSCTTATAAIRYNWRLILAPPSVLDYVAAHEVAHLLEANHGPRFWAVVERLYGDPADARRWLKAHGASLHAVG